MTWPIGHSFRVTVSGKIASKKNSRRWLRRGKRRFLLPSPKSQNSAIALRLAWREAGGPMFDKGDILSLTCTYSPAADATTIVVAKVGELRVGEKHPKSDTHGMVEGIADALEGEAYPNDRQIHAGSFSSRILVDQRTE
jgi:hypothetical protein